MQAIDSRCALLDQLVPVIDDTGDVVGVSYATRRRQVVFSGGDTGDLQPVSIWSVLAPVRRARRAAAVISSGDLHHGHAGFDERFCRRAAEVARAFDRHRRLCAARPGAQGVVAFSDVGQSPGNLLVCRLRR